VAGDPDTRASLSTVQGRVQARPPDDGDEWPEEEAVRRAIRRMGSRALKNLAVALAGAGGGVGLTMVSAPAPVPVEPPTVVVEPVTTATDKRCQVSAETEQLCARAVHDARTAIDYFAVLADACELPKDARPSPPP
jgi:hypothetical protein